MSRGRPVATVSQQQQDTKIWPDYPLLASLRSISTNNGEQTSLEFRDLVVGELLQSMYITGPRNVRSPAGLTFDRDLVLVHKGNRLLFCTIPGRVRKKSAPAADAEIPAAWRRLGQQTLRGAVGIRRRRRSQPLRGWREGAKGSIWTATAASS